MAIGLKGVFLYMSEIEQIAPIVTRRLRREVLYPNQPIESILLEEDDAGIHFGLYEENKLIAVVSLFIRGQEAQFRKFATDTNHQNKGYGSQLLQYIIHYAHIEGVQKIWCNARISAVPFYRKRGFTAIGNSFIKGEIEYIKMEKMTTKTNE